MKTSSWLIALLLVLAATAHAQTPPRNVLFIVVDDLRPEFGAYGATYIDSPNLDALAQSGMRFDRAYCQQAVCSPSRSSVMTGARPDTTQVWDLTTHFRTAMPNVVTMSQYFKNRKNYHARAIGKIYHDDLQDNPSWSEPALIFGGGPYALQVNKDANAVGKGPPFESAPNVNDDVYEDGKTAEAAVQLLDTINPSVTQKPFFLAVGFAKPHLPFSSPKRFWDKYEPANIELAPNDAPPENAPEYAIKVNAELRGYSGIPVTAYGEPLPDNTARQLKHGYYAAISYVDAQIGKVLTKLDQLGLRQNTIVVLWGDHGYKLGEHASWCKHTNCENDTRVPLIIAAPGLVTPGSSTKKIVELVDLYPTLLDLAGGGAWSKPAHLEGLSFKPLIDNPNDATITWKEAAFSQYPRTEKLTPGSPVKTDLMGYTMRTARYRFTDWQDLDQPGGINATELYDHQTDPQENTNLALDPAKAGLVNSLRTKLNAGWQSVRDAVPPTP